MIVYAQAIEADRAFDASRARVLYTESADALSMASQFCKDAALYVVLILSIVLILLLLLFCCLNACVWLNVCLFVNRTC